MVTSNEGEKKNNELTSANLEEATNQEVEEKISFPEDVDEMYMNTMKNLREGEVVTGTVIDVTKDFVIVDVGYKSEGQVAVDEFKDDNGEVTVSAGDRVDVYIVEAEDETGSVILSKDKADKQRVWEEISRSYEEGLEVEGTIVQRTKGGLIVDIGVRAFLPGSQIDLRPVRDMDNLIGQKIKFQVIQYNRKRSNIVLSRRQLLEKERKHLREKTIEKLEEGAVVIGTVKNITDYGVFIDLGGIDGLLHITDISWGKVNHPADYFKVGDQVEVMVLNFDEENMRVSLGLKQTTENPWDRAEEKYPPGAKVQGEVVNITDYGAFVELEEGIEGLIHITEMSWSKKLRHPSKIVNISDVVESEVLELDVDNRRISLSIKNVQPNPWDILKDKYEVGSVVEGRVKNITDFGMFIDIDEEIDGLVHISDLTRKKRVKHPSELYKRGQKVKAAVLRVDKDAGRFSLSIKQLEPDPWEEIPVLHPPGSVVSGRVTKIADFGAFVEIMDGVEGLVHVSELKSEKVEHPKDVLEVNQQLDFKVINIDPKEKKIGLSLKALDKDKENSATQSYLKQQDTGKVQLGAIFEQQMANSKLNEALISSEQKTEEAAPEAEEVEAPETEKAIEAEEAAAEEAPAGEEEAPETEEAAQDKDEKEVEPADDLPEDSDESVAKDEDEIEEEESSKES